MWAPEDDIKDPFFLSINPKITEMTLFGPDKSKFIFWV